MFSLPRQNQRDRKKGLYLIEECLGAVSNCEFGLWTNGSDLIYLQKAYKEDELNPVYEELADFPGAGETLDDLNRPDRQLLRNPAGESLLQTFKRCHDYIYGNQGKIKTAFWELLNIIFCKI